MNANLQLRTHLFPLLGMVMCGGESVRMGQDKSGLIYRQRAQRLVVQELLSPYCELVALSCNASQGTSFASEGLIITDALEYQQIGPMAALLTASKLYPSHNILIIGCDYPLFETEELGHFLLSIKQKDRPHAFFNKDGFYEPLLAYYPASSMPELKNQYMQGIFSLQHYLRQSQGHQHKPLQSDRILSVDTPEEYNQALARIKLE